MTAMRKISILGSTGSIGTQALDVVASHPDRFSVKALACGRNTTLLSEQIKRFQPELVSVERPSDAQALAKEHPGVEVLCGEEGLIAAAVCDCDIVLNALMGMRGLVPVSYTHLLSCEAGQPGGSGQSGRPRHQQA